METHRKRDFWSDRDTREMLSLINKKHVEELRDNKTKFNRKIFQAIASDLRKRDVIKSDVQIRNKFKSLKSDFFRVKRNKSAARRQTTEQFDLLDAIFGHGPVLESEGIDIIKMDIENVDDEANVSAYDETVSIEKVECEKILDAYDEVASIEKVDNEQNLAATFDEVINLEKVDNKQILAAAVAFDEATSIEKDEDEEFLTAFDEAASIEKDVIIDTTQNAVERPVIHDFPKFKRTKKQSYQNVVNSFTKDWRDSQQELLKSMQAQDEQFIDMQSKRQEQILEKNLKSLEKILEKDREETAKMIQGFLNAIQPIQPTLPGTFHSSSQLFMEPSSSDAIYVPISKTSPKDNEDIY